MPSDRTQYLHDWFQANKARIYERRKERRKSESDTVRSIEAHFRERHREELIEYRRQYRAKNREKLRDQAKALRIKNIEKYREQDRLQRTKHRGKRNARKLAHYRANYEAYKANNYAWRRANAERWRAILNFHNRRRRTQKFHAGGSHTLSQITQKFAYYGNRCVYCGSARMLTIDHVKSLIKGGSDWIANIVPACHSCNSKKRDRSAMPFLRLPVRLP